MPENPTTRTKKNKGTGQLRLNPIFISAISAIDWLNSGRKAEAAQSWGADEILEKMYRTIAAGGENN
jgi:hypothetical protein